MTILNIAYVVFAVLLLFGAAIFFHELGHFWVARKLGMKVEEFAIGMGPKIYSWTRNGIVYSIRWIPAGGFVKLPQMITSETLEGQAETKVPPAPPLHKILVAVAGPAMNVIFAFVIATLIYFVGLPTLVNPSVIGQVDPTSAEGKLGIKEGDRIVMVNDHPVESWQDVTFETLTATTNVLPVAIARGKETNVYHLTASASPVGGKWLNLDPREHPIVGSVESDMPAAKVDLHSGDRIVAVNGIPTPSQERMMEVISNAAGMPCEIAFTRNGEKKIVTITPKYDPATKRARIGISFSPGVYEVKRPGPLPWVQIEEVTDRTFGTISALIHSKQTGVKVKDLSGPVGILSILAAQVNADYRLALSFLVLLNINLAIINLLPIPVLDGGHVLMAIIESIRRRPLSPKIVEYVTTGFAVLLICFMVYVTVADIKRFSLFRAMFRNGTQIEEPQNQNQNSPAAPAPAEPR
ncbi:MAG TPA: RIP metalloprotease RseP [Verrucomicrobiae bacterium]|jgi:regulator of sigma E protease|nr:RIP metalloprotease RseP [Verrucomicrobiae bacterium]